MDQDYDFIVNEELLRIIESYRFNMVAVLPDPFDLITLQNDFFNIVDYQFWTSDDDVPPFLSNPIINWSDQSFIDLAGANVFIQQDKTRESSTTIDTSFILDIDSLSNKQLQDYRTKGFGGLVSECDRVTTLVRSNILRMYNMLNVINDLDKALVSVNINQIDIITLQMGNTNGTYIQSFYSAEETLKLKTLIQETVVVSLLPGNTQRFNALYGIEHQNESINDSLYNIPDQTLIINADEYSTDAQGSIVEPSATSLGQNTSIVLLDVNDVNNLVLPPLTNMLPYDYNIFASRGTSRGMTTVDYLNKLIELTDLAPFHWATEGPGQYEGGLRFYRDLHTGSSWLKSSGADQALRTWMEPTAIPEPTTLLLLGMGGLVLRKR